jgi:hypothetical protein
MQSKGWSKGSWPEKGWGQKGQEKGKGKGGKGKGAMNIPWGGWWNNAAPAASGLNWIDGPPGMGQPAWGGEQWGDTSLFSLQPEVPNIIKKPVSIHNRWKALQQEDEDINYDLTDTKGPTENIKEEFEHAGWKVVQKKSQSNKSESNRKGGKESSKSENNRSGTTQIYGKFGKSTCTLSPRRRRRARSRSWVPWSTGKPLAETGPASRRSLTPERWTQWPRSRWPRRRRSSHLRDAREVSTTSLRPATAWRTWASRR